VNLRIERPPALSTTSSAAGAPPMDIMQESGITGEEAVADLNADDTCGRALRFESRLPGPGRESSNHD
jgi:hypothetical protein